MSAPDSPLSPLAATAIALHEFFTALVEAGFSEQQALSLVVAATRANRGDGEH